MHTVVPRHHRIHFTGRWSGGCQRSSPCSKQRQSRTPGYCGPHSGPRSARGRMPRTGICSASARVRVDDAAARTGLRSVISRYVDADCDGSDRKSRKSPRAVSKPLQTEVTQESPPQSPQPPQRCCNRPRAEPTAARLTKSRPGPSGRCGQTRRDRTLASPRACSPLSADRQHARRQAAT